MKRGKQTKDRIPWETSVMNNRVFLHYYNRLTELAISMFEWKNLPDTIDARFMELILYSDGYAVFFRDEELGELCLQCMIGGHLDVYRVPTIRRAYATNGYNRQLDNTNSVIIYNNYLRTNSMPDMELYAQRLYDIQRTMDVNIKQQKTPAIIRASEDEKVTLMNVMKQRDDNELVIFGTKNLDLKQNFQVFPTTAPFISTELMDLKFKVWNEALTQLGISNVNMHKKERLLNDEVTRNMGSTVASKFTRLNARKEACKKINDMFGLDIDVEYRSDIEVIANMAGETFNVGNGGEENE